MRNGSSVEKRAVKWHSIYAEAITPTRRSPLTHFIILVPLVAAGGLVGRLHEGIRRKRLAARLFSNTTRGAPDVEAPVADMQVVGSDDLVQIRHSERAAHVALGVSTASRAAAATGAAWAPSAIGSWS
jgi:hypothetical protein